MQSTIELECPTCSEMLEIDAGFAGGVCRCFSCGTLMTVPEDPGVEQAESLSRPEAPGRPAEPGGVADAATSPSAGGDVDDTWGDAPKAEPDARTALENVPTAAGDPGETPADLRGSAIDAGDKGRRAAPVAIGGATYTTSSGRTVHVDENAAIPTARKRKRMGVRVVTGVVAFAVIGGIVAACVFAIGMLIRGMDGPATSDADGDPITLAAPEGNPFLSVAPGYFGLPLTNDTVVAFDASEESGPWLAYAEDALMFAVKNLDQPIRLRFVAWNESAPQGWPDRPQIIGPDDAPQLKDFLNTVSPSGHAVAAEAVANAVIGGPKRVILVTGQDLTHDEVRAVENVLRTNATDLRVDAILVGGESPALRSLVQDRQGQMLKVTPLQLEQWFREAMEEGVAVIDWTEPGF